MKIAVARPILAAALLALSSCGGNTPEVGAPQPSPPASNVTARWDNLPEGKTWTGYTLAALDAFGADLVATVPKDIEAYCPKYPSADAAQRKAFWVGLLSALTRWESNYRPAESFVEPEIKDAQGNNVTSRGLLQISIESGRGYGCVIENEQRLHDPEVNLTCAVRIFNRLVPKGAIIGPDSAPWTGASAYWSPFRKADRRADMRKWTNEQAYCKL